MLILLYLSYIFTLIGYLKVWNLWNHIPVTTLIIEQNDAELPLIFFSNWDSSHIEYLPFT